MLLFGMIRAGLIAAALACMPAGAASAQPPDGEVSLASLIGNPAAHDGQRVRVAGYFSGWHFEDCALYLSKADFEQSIHASAVEVAWRGCHDQRAGALDRRYAIFEGVFHADRGPYAGGFTGVIRNITVVERNVSLAEFRQQTTMSVWREHGLKIISAVLFTLLATHLAHRLGRRLQRGRP